jgi:hypothetical protein
MNEISVPETSSRSDQDPSDEEVFLDNLPQDGSQIANKRLREPLGWPEEKYWQVRSDLYNSGKISLGRGRGGSVRKILSDTMLISDTMQTRFLKL